MDQGGNCSPKSGRLAVADYTNSITVDDAIDALAGLVRNFTGNAVFTRGQANRVSYPEAPFVMMTELRRSDLQIPHVEYEQTTDADHVTINNSQVFDIQVDFYASNAGDMCAAVMTALRSPWGWDQFSPGIRPLYTRDGRQAPLITGEQQYANRWILDVSLQCDPVFTAPQQYANHATATVFLADS